MLKTIGATFLSAVLTSAAVVSAASSLSKRSTTQAATVSTATVSESASLQSSKYSGKHSDWVRKLLSRAGSWKCPANASDSGTPPSVKVDACMRDKYVAAAVLYAWAAECYARQDEDAKAGEAADQMYENLKSAKGLCSDAPSVGGGGCDTIRIFSCDEAL